MKVCVIYIQITKIYMTLTRGKHDRASVCDTHRSLVGDSNPYRPRGWGRLVSKNPWLWFIQFACLLFASAASAQTYQINAVNGQTVTTSSGTFYDSGGSGGSYGNNESYQVTFYSGGANKMRLDFSAFDVESGYDFLKIYDGASTSSTQLGSWSGSTSPGTVTGSGSYLTVVFTSDYSVTATGWTALISTVSGGTTLTTTATDDFSSKNYSGGTGWTGDWIDEEPGATSYSNGNLRALGNGTLRLYSAISGNGGLYRDVTVPQTTVSSADLTFRYRGNSGNDAGQDLLITEFSSNGGASYTEVSSLFRTSTSFTGSGTINLSGITGPGTYRIRFRMTSGTQSSEDYYIDDVVLTVTGNTAPPAVSDYGDYSGFPAATQNADSAIRIGTLATDAEASSPANGTATGDDNVGDDEDLTMPSFTVGAATTLTVPVTISGAVSSARLNVFVDWNGDGDVNDSGETQTVQSVTSSGTRTFTLTPPTGTTPGTKYLRLRFVEGSTAPAFSGTSTLKGEVEDYAITVDPAPTLDYGDYSGFAAAAQTADSAIRIGTIATDYEDGVWANSSATGDDNDATDDEDLAMPAFTAGVATNLVIPVTISGTVTSARINVFVDWNGDGDVDDSGETQTVQSVTSSGNRTFVLTPPMGTSSGTKYLRVRFVEGTTAPTFSGVSMLRGEVEDYAVDVTSTDFGDYSGFAAASSIADPTIRIGATVDAEQTPTTNASATGDDLTGIDDEDGVTLASTLVTGTSNSMVVNVTNTSTGLLGVGTTAYLSVWIDFNGNGNLTDSGEQVASNTLIASGTSNSNRTISFTVPADAPEGVVGVRVRLTSAILAGPTGASGNGEVEDYVVTLVCPTITLSPTTLPVATVGSVYDTNVITASGGRSPYTFAITSGTLPAGLTFNSSNGNFSGTPTAGNGAGTSITVTATDKNGCAGSQVYNLQICPLITLSPATLPNGMVNSAYSQTVSGGGGASPYLYAVSSGSLPAGLTLDANTGVISGRPTAASSSSFTITATGGNGCTGSQSYSVTTAAPTDFGDYAAFGSASSAVISTLKIGALTDAEITAVTDGSATGDDLTDLADEDGITAPAYVTQGVASSLTVNVTNTTGSSAYLNVWIDFSGNGVLTDSGEQVATNTLVATGSSNLNRTVSFTVPATAKLGQTGIRVRLTSTSSPGPTGASGNGEVEDSMTSVVLPVDSGDFSLFGSASSVASTTLRMGALVDSEVTATTNATATGDDITGVDDEDGVTLPASATLGQSGVTVTVQVTNTTGAQAFVNGWIDFNNNGVLTDAGEQIVFNDPVATGASNVSRSYTFTVPTSATPGPVGVRFRLSSTDTPGSTGLSGTGEVEDNTLTILATSDYGDYSRFASASSLISSSLKMGALVDADSSSNTNLSATADDITNVNDEDGAVVQAILVQGQAGVAVTLNVTNLSGAPAYLNGWVDFNNNGVLTDAGEQIVGNVVVANGTSDDYQTFFFDVPINAALGSIGTRFRLTSVSSPGPVSASGNGEVEDYTTTVVAPSSNFRDYFYALRHTGSTWYLDEISVYNPNSATPTVSITQGILNLNASTPGFNASASNAFMNGLALDWLNRRFYWNSTSSGSSGYNFQLNTAYYDNVTKTWGSQAVTGSNLSNIPFNTGTPNSSAAGSGAFPRAAYYAGDYYGGGQNNDNVVAWHLDSTGKALLTPKFTDYPNFFHLTQKFGGGDFVIRPQDGLLVTSTAVNNTANTLYNQFMTNGFNPNGSAATSVNIDSKIPVSSNSAIQIAGVGGVTRLYGVAANSATVYRLDDYDTSSPKVVKVGNLPTSSGTGYDDLSEGISSSVTSLGVKGIVYEDANGLTNSTVDGIGTNTGGTLFALLVDGAGNLVDSFPVKDDGTFILGGATANTSYTVVLSTTYGSLGSTAPPAALPQGWVNVGEFLGSGAGSDGSVNGVLSVSIGNAGIVNAKFGIVQGFTLGNLVWNDANNNGLRDVGENGIGGVTVQLWTPGSDNAIGGTGLAADTMVDFTTTDATGTYNFTNLLAGKYFVRVTPPALYSSASGGVSGDNGVDNDNNGSQPGGRATAVFSPVVDLARGKEPGNLASGGSNTENTIDFGLLTATDYGDFAAFGGAGSAVVTNLYLGALIDSEYAPLTNANATGDDLDAVDDEDGVTVPANLITGTPNSLTVNVTNTSGSSAFLHVWIDFNRNGVLTDAGEQVASNILIANGSSQTNRIISFTVPATATVGVAGVRVRLTSVYSPGATGTIGNGEVEDYTTNIIQPTTDFGDELDFADASSTASTSLRLGALVDVEGVSTKTANADGDDLSGVDDEDGVNFPYLTAGQPVSLPVSVTNTTGAPAYLNAWIDFNNNGVLTDPGEQIANNVIVATGTLNGTTTLNFTVPTDAVTAANSVGTRFRLTNVASPGSTGQAGTGEVEDHPLVILAPLTDFGDHSGYPDVSNTATSNLRLGALVDTEYAATANLTATGDDITGNDDEDGVVLPSMIAGAPVTIPVTVTNTSGGAGFLNAWIDYNNNGDFNDAGEQIGNNIVVSNGWINAVLNLNTTVPATAATGVNVGVRVRITALASPGNSGSGGLGEVEDYAINIAEPTTDFGDFADFDNASSTRDNAIELGLLVDTEYVATTNAAASGDDTTASDDEDAVTFPTLIAGAPATIPVRVTNTSAAAVFLNAWIDFNNDGEITDDEEQIATDISIPPGSNNITQNLNITVPPTALSGVNLGARFRLTNTSGTEATGAVGRGEVEDYIVTVEAPTTDFGDFIGFADASQGANPALRLGSLLDVEYASTRNADATGDDITGSDDEDGVGFPSMTAGQTVTIPITVTNTTGANGYLNVWIDFNNNGVLTDTGEHLATNLIIPTGSVNAVTNLEVVVPPNATTGVNLGARFRLSAPSGLGPTGANGLAGEVEDYVVNIAAPTTDFGDFLSFADASSLGTSAIKLGALTDLEFLSTRNATASGDDVTGIDDEDAVTLPSMIAGAPAAIPVLVTNTSGSTVFLNAWIDYNNDGLLTGPGEQIASNVSVANGTNNSARTINVTVPTNAVTGVNVGMRVRLTSTSTPGPTGASGNGEVEDYVVTIAAPTTDFGDLSAYGDASNGVSNSLRLGALVDAEFAATRNADATGDDITGSDDEDGVNLPSITAGQTASVPVTVTNGTGSTAFLNAWIDFNNNGSFGDAGEQVVINTGVIAGLTNSVINVSVPVPATATTGTNVGVRFRLTSTSSPGATGNGGGIGEVEDYVINIGAAPTDFGDFSGFNNASSIASTAVRMGGLVDAEFAPVINGSATGDDITGSDDEDGVTLPTMTAGAPATIPVVVTNTSGSPAYLNAWVDFNHNGVLTDAGEQIAANVLIADGTSNAVQDIELTVPANAVTGVALGARFRLTSTSTPGPTGASGTGEVEDYVATISVPPLDFGDWSGLADASSTASANLRLGTRVDTEYVSTRNSSASGDDDTGVDDEDGVALPTMTAGAPATIPVIVTNTTGALAYLNVWFDLNNNGSMADPGEQIATNIVVQPGASESTINLNHTIPANAITGTQVGLRFRLTSTISPGVTGESGIGEVEDYVVSIAVPVTDFGDWAGAASVSNLASSDLRMGPLADSEYVMTVNSDATGDDITGSDDEDGVTLPASLTPGTSANASVEVTNNTGAPGYINAWIDFNNDGAFDGPGEQIATNVVVASGTNAAAVNVTFNVPVDAIPEQRGVRFRFTDVQNPSSVGAGGVGEVEDYIVSIGCAPFSINPAAISASTIGSSYSQTLTANGVHAPFVFDLTDGALPAGLTLNSSTGVISGTPTSKATATFTITATDGQGCTATRTYTHTPTCPTISLSPASIANAMAGTAYTQTVSASGGTGPYTYAITSGALPAWATLNASTGVVSGMPFGASTSTFTVTATDANACEGSRAYTLTVTCPAIKVSPLELSPATVGMVWTQQMIAGPSAALTGSYYSGSNFTTLLLTRDEASINYNWSTGSPDPSVPADKFSVRWDGSLKPSATGTYTFQTNSDDGVRLWVNNVLVINQWNDHAATIHTGTVSLTAGVTVPVRLEYYENGGYAVAQLQWSGPSMTMHPVTEWTTIGGSGPYVWSVASGVLPTGITLDPDTGILSGTPTSTASKSFVLRATDANGCYGTGAYTLTPDPGFDYGDYSLFGSASSRGYTTVRMGAAIDTENAQVVNSTATGDDTTGIDDEDGVTVPTSATVGGTHTLVVNVTNTNGTSAYLNAWIDFNHNGILTDPGEQVTTNQTVANGVSNINRYLSFVVPSDAYLGDVGVRVRITSTANPGPTGASGNGEVEDNLLTIVAASDYGDHASLGIASSTPSTSLRIGATVDGEPNAVTDATATGDDLNGIDDEDGVTIPATLQQGTNQTITVNVTNTTALTGFLNVWIDWNKNGVLTDAGEQVAANLAVAPGTNAADRAVTFTVPSGIAPGDVPVRVRLTTTSTTLPVGASGNGEVEDYVATVTCAPVVVSPATLPVAVKGAAYNQTLTASGLASPITFAITSGTLPSGLTFNTATGVISGTPTAGNGTGTSITVQATGLYGCQGTRTYTLQVCPVLDLAPTSPPVPVVGSLYSSTVTTTGGSAPYTYSISSGTLPTGLALNTGTGEISGTATNTTSAAFTVRALDANGCPGTRSYTLTSVCPTITINPSLLPNGTAGAAYSQTMTGSGGTAPYSFAITAGALPTGLSLSSAGILSGTPTTSNGAGTSVTVRATDKYGCVGTSVVTLQICPVITLTPTTLSAPTVGSSYSTVVAAGGGASPYVYSISSGNLPAGLTLNGSTGEISGTSTSTASETFTVSAVDANGCPGTRTYTVTPVCPVITVTPASLPAGTVGVAYSQTMAATGGTAPRTFAISSGTLPAGLTLNTSTGEISGTPTAGNGAGDSITVRATDAYGCQGTRTLNLQICPLVTLSPSSLAAATVGTPYSDTVTAGAGVAPYVYSISSGSLPAGLTLNTSSGAITGTPTSATEAIFTVRAVDANGCAGSQAYTLTPACPVISINPTTLANGTVGTAFSQALSTTAGSPSFTYALSAGALPPGITLSSGGLLSGTPTMSGSYSLTVRVTDTYGCTGTRTFSWRIDCPVIVIAPATLSQAIQYEPYSTTLSATNGTTPYSWTITAGSLPTGLTLSTGGVLSGTATSAPGTYNITVRAQDTYGCATTKDYSFVVVCNAVAISPATLPYAYYNVAFSQTLTATKGTAPFTWSVTSGAPPAGITLSAAGVLSGTSTVYGPATFTVAVTDANGCTGSRNMTLTVKGLTIGNLVFDDANFNGLRDVDEPGVPNVTVQLWDSGADHAVGGSGADADVQVRTDITTDANGGYQFADLAPGWYFVRVMPPSNLHYRGGAPVNLDNGVDGDNNAALQPGGSGTVITGPVIQLDGGTEPVSEDGDADTDLTVDFGLFAGMRIGNLVWDDTNDNGLHDIGETGIDGVNLEVWTAGVDGLIGGDDDVRIATTTSAGGGIYSFSDLPPEKVYVRVPAPPAAHPFASSIAFAPGTDDDNDGYQVSSGSIYSGTIDLAVEGAAGHYTLNTVDFGLGLPGNAASVYLSSTKADGIHSFNASTGLFNGSLNHPFGSSQSQGNSDSLDVPYAMEFGPDGNWYVAHPGANNLRKIALNGADLGVALDSVTAGINGIKHFAFGPDRNFYVVDESGDRIVRFAGPLSGTPGQPMGSAPYTFISQSGIVDVNFCRDGNLCLVVQNGASSEIRRYNLTTGALMNVIATSVEIAAALAGGDANPEITGVDIFGGTLYGANNTDGEVFSIDLNDPASPGTPQLVATLASAGKGTVSMGDIEFNPFNGSLYVAGNLWGKPVGAGTFDSGSLVRVDPSAAPNGSVSIFEDPIPAPPGPDSETFSGPSAVAIGRSFAPLPETVSVGSLVWHDEDVDGHQGASEPGIPNVRVELWRDANNNVADGAETLIGWTFTDAAGHYYFSGQAPGVYQVKVAASNFGAGMPLDGTEYSTPISSNTDDQIDGDDSGRQPAGPFTVVHSPLLSLTPGTEPTGDGSSGAESGRGGDLDDYTVDANGDMTVDFGFVEPGIMGIGNLVFVDENANNHFDLGEGWDGAIVELYRWGNVPGVDDPVATTTTAGGGLFLFSNLWQGQYFLHLPASQFLATGDMRGLFSLLGTSAGDDDVGEDSLDTDQPWVTGISSTQINLVREQAPVDATTETGYDSTSDLDDLNINLTVDFGLFRAVSIGNLVFEDANSSGGYNSGEELEGVLLELYDDVLFPGVDTPLATTTSGPDGRYLFNFLRAGNYVVHIPKSQFLSGAPLYQRVSIAEGNVGDDDIGEDGINNGDPVDNGISSSVISLFPGNAPTDGTGETGVDHESDNEVDAAVDLTIDFGFQSPVGVGNLVYIDSNGNGLADPDEGIDGVTVALYRSDQTPGVSIPLFTQVTAGGGRYFFRALPSGSYKLHIPASEFGFGRPLFGLQSSPGAGSVTSVVDDDVAGNENGIDDSEPSINGISTEAFTLVMDGQPLDSEGETGASNDLDAFDDNNFDLTIDFGFSPGNPDAVGVGNLVFTDLNGNGAFDEGEGVADVHLQLFAAAADPYTATPLATTTTAADGTYLFANLAAGDYKIFIPASEFGAGKPLQGWLSLAGNGGDFGYDDDIDENGVDAANPAASGIVSLAFNLSPNEEPINSLGEFGYHSYTDDLDDDNTDLTIDFGFFRSVAVGNLVFIDANHNGHADAGEGVANVELEIYEEGMIVPFDPPVATTTTETDGSYLFDGLAPGSYYVRIAPSQFGFGMPLYGLSSLFGVQTGDDNSGEDGLDDGQPSYNGIQSGVFTLSITGSPTGSQEGGLFGSSDDTRDNSVDLTIDFGFVTSVSIGNLVFDDVNEDGIFDPFYDAGIDGVTVELHSVIAGVSQLVGTTTTFNGGLYRFDVAPGSYYVAVPADDFSSGFTLEGMVPSQAAGASGQTVLTTTSGDDDVGQDGYTIGSVTSDGARTAVFTIASGSAPVEATGETGYLFDDDDYMDADSDLTVDLGFKLATGQAAGTSMRRDLSAGGGTGSAASTSPATFTAWQTQNSLSGTNDANADPDADGLTNLMEYALGTPAQSGLGASRFVLETNAVTGGIDVLLTRPSGEHRDLRYFLEGSSDLVSWTTMAVTPVVTAGANLTETLRFADLASRFNGAAQGFVRIKVTLDADLDGTPEAVATTSAQGWAHRMLPVGRQTLSMPLLKSSIFTGRVTAVSGSTAVINTGGNDIRALMPADQSFYAEVLDGALAGRTWNIAAGSSSTTSVTFTTPTDPAMNGARISIRPHWTLGSLVPVAGLQASADQTTADRVMFFDMTTNNFQIYWLRSAKAGSQWVLDGDTSFADAGVRIVPPQEGALIQMRATPGALILLGEVRYAPLALPQTSGTRLIGSGLPLPQAPGAQQHTTGSRLRLWSGDTDPAVESYQNYLFNGQSRWIDESTQVDVTTQPLLDAFRAFFLVKP